MKCANELLCPGDAKLDVDKIVNFKSKDFLDSVKNVLLHIYPRYY